MSFPTTALVAFATALFSVGPGLGHGGQTNGETKDKKDIKRPTLSIRATPMMAFAPARLFVSAELRGGPNDFEEYYCPTVEWDWDDGTKSQSTVDCEPYEAGKSEIKRRFSIEHIYKIGGMYKIEIRLKRKDKILTTSSVTVQIRAALNEPPQA